MPKIDHDAIRKLYATGLHTQNEVAQIIGCHSTTAYRAMRSHVETPHNGRTVRIVNDPSGRFEPGAGFSMSDLVFGAIPDEAGVITWAHCTEFRIGRDGNQKRAWCIGKVIFREDGTRLQTDSSGGATWVKVELLP